MPYGYKRGVHSKNEYVRDDAVADVVRQIFQMAADGRTYASIAETLSKEGVDPPQKYRLIASGVDAQTLDTHAFDKWNPMAIRRIVTNPVYLGHLPHSREVREKCEDAGDSLDSKIRVKDHHEPIVTLPLFQAANALRGAPSQENNLTNLFAGIVFCASCGSPLVSGKESSAEGDSSEPVLRCPRKQRTKNRCPAAAEIKMNKLEGLVLSDLNEIIDEMNRQSKADAAQSTSGSDDPHKADMQRLSAIQERLEMISTVTLRIYEDMERGLLHRYSGQEMIRIYHAEITDLLAEKDHLSSFEAIGDQETPIEQPLDCFEQLGKIKELNSTVLSTFIKRIEIGPKTYQGDAKGRARATAFFDQAVDITYTFGAEQTV